MFELNIFDSIKIGLASPEKIREGVMKLGKLIEKKLAQQSK